MQILGSNQHVCFERLYPFEHRYLTYVYNMARIISLPAKVDEPWDNDLLFQGKQRMVGCLPYGSIQIVDREKLSDRSFVALWNEFSAEMRNSSKLKPGTAGFYAEKVPTYVAERANDLLKARNIFLLREVFIPLVGLKTIQTKPTLRKCVGIAKGLCAI